MRLGQIAGLCMGMFAGSASAHPHIFVDTTLKIVVEQGHAVAVELSWSYDDFFSLLIFEDMGLDRDYDGVLTAAELDALRGFDMREWPDGFEGDLYVWENGQKVALPFPEVTGIKVVNGRIVASHRRELPDVAVQDLRLKQFDPTYYVAYRLMDVTASGDCKARVKPHDPGAADRALQQALAEVPEDRFDVLEMGRHYADEVRLICSGSS